MFEALQGSIQGGMSNIIHRSTQIKAALLEAIGLIHESNHCLKQALVDQSNSLAKSTEFVRLPKKRTRGTAAGNFIQPAKPVSTNKDEQSNPSYIQFLSSPTSQKVLGHFSWLILQATGKLALHAHTAIYTAVTTSGSMRLKVKVYFTIPSIVLVPSIANVSEQVNTVIAAIDGTIHRLQLWGERDRGKEEEFLEGTVDTMHDMMTKLKDYFESEGEEN